MKYLFLTFFLLSGYTASSQSFIGKLIVGGNASQIDGDGVGGYNLPGLCLGAGVNLPVNERISIEADFLYSMKGSRASIDQIEKGLAPQFRINLNYIEFPILFNYRVREDLQLFIGPGINPLVSARSDNGAALDNENIRSQYHPVDFTANLGLEYFFAHHFGANLRMCYSAVSANPSGGGAAYVSPLLAYRPGNYNNTLSVSIRYYFAEIVDR